jgi:hypothetical protein
VKDQYKDTLHNIGVVELQSIHTGRDWKVGLKQTQEETDENIKRTSRGTL